MSIQISLRGLRRPVAAVVALGLATAGVLVVATPASASTQTATSGSASWGVKQSFRDYIADAVGAVEFSDGAALLGSVMVSAGPRGTRRPRSPRTRTR